MDRFTKIIASIAGALAFCVMAVGCASTPSYQVVDTTDRTLKQIHSGRLVNTDIRIVARDGSFELKGGENFDVPFQCDLWSPGTPFAMADNTLYQALALGDSFDVVSRYDKAKAAGCKEVDVYIDGQRDPLHGVLALSPVFNAAAGPASNAYFIRVETDQMKTAYDGNTVVFFERANWRTTLTRVGADGSRVDLPGRYESTWYTWILWVSYMPL